MSPYSNPPKKITLSNFDNINNPVEGSILLSESGEFTNKDDITITEDFNNFNILSNKKRSINIGNKTVYQTNNTNICIGPLTGDGVGNSSNIIAIGAENQKLTMAGNNNISIGHQSSQRGNTTVSNSISLGYHSGTSFKKSYNVGIGTNTSYGGGGANTIAISTITAINVALDNALYIKPIRALAVGGMPQYALSYDPTTGEWTYNP